MKSLLPEIAFRKLTAGVGTPGSGKSYNMAQQIAVPVLKAGGQFIGIDPTGAWFGLTLDPSGKKPSGLNIAVFGGDHGNMALTPNMGRAIGELLGREPISAVLDLSNFELGEQIHFMSDFAVTIIKHNKKPVTLLIDEVDEFCPQMATEKGELSVCKGRVKRLVTRGRKRGFRPVILTQRPQAVDKGMFNMVQCLVAFQCSGHHERKQIDEYVKSNGDPKVVAQMLQDIPSLNVGEAWIWAPRKPGFLAKQQFGKLSVYDSFKEEDEEGGFEGAVPLSDDKLEGIRAALKDHEAEMKANDPDALHAQIDELQRALKQALNARVRDTASVANEVAAGGFPPIKPSDVQKARKGGWDAGFKAGKLSGGYDGWHLGYNDGWRAHHQHSVSAIAETRSVPERGDRGGPAVPAPGDLVDNWSAPAPVGAKPLSELRAEQQGKAKELAAGVDRGAVREVFAAAPVVSASTSKGPRRILEAVAWWESVGFENPTRNQVAVMASYKPDTGNTRTHIGAAVANGWLEEAGAGRVKPRANLATKATPETTEGLETPRSHVLKRVRGLITESERRIFDVVLAASTDAISRKEAASRAGYEPDTGNTRTKFGELVSWKIIEAAGTGEVKVAPWVLLKKG